ncbi:mitotic checkpoint regulator, MAD2B-interacting-domain-containing protein [Pterulicium gracile]|uniref:Mitotic checkpoint regulator, MAD2B-interacting-domain-containing protein n=1 Tax=Pterulicium gracile TaxID=1884261 RepID=A0A5C3Q0A4_9AGAR|nr:mitotic checkpoint regulator, MAD2B-interacting-domain-containing protein [Pterula gracilis]
MLGVEGYGSDAGSDDEQQTQTTATLKPTSINVSTSKPPPASSSSKSFLPPPKSTSGTKRAPKKIAFGLPTITAPEDDSTSKDDLDDMQPPLKKPRLEAGSGKSSLLSSLPAPKNKASAVPKQPERVLGGGGGKAMIFSAAPSETGAVVEEAATDFAALPFLPASLGKGKANISLEDEGRPRKTAAPAPKPKVQSAPAVDFFSLGSSSSAPSSSSAASSSIGPKLKSSAPEVIAYRPPSPTPTDPYPGYYQLPSGDWAAHDPVYYSTYTLKWKKEYDSYVRALEQGKTRGFEDMDESTMGEVDAHAEMERAKEEVKAREERKDLTRDKGAPAMPKMKLTAAKQTGIARSRHQLSTLLNEAYTNREALEEKIAQGRRNRKEAGNKYGF